MKLGPYEVPPMSLVAQLVNAVLAIALGVTIVLTGYKLMDPVVGTVFGCALIVGGVVFNITEFNGRIGRR